MPLRDNCDQNERQTTIAFNIRELMQSWENTRMINGDKIRSRKEALRRATAISLSLCSNKPKKNDKEE